VILAGNKWDLVEEPERATKELRDEMGRRFQFLRFAPVLTLSALTGLRVEKLFAQIDAIEAASDLRLPTPAAQRFLKGEIDTGRAPIFSHDPVGVRPPHVLRLHARLEEVHFSLRRRLENRLRERFDFGPTPIVLRFRSAAKRREHA